MGETVRFGVSLDSDLLEKFDALCERQGCPSRSEALRDIIRDALVQDSLHSETADAAGVLSLIYDHHVRDLSRKLTERQHDAHGIIIIAWRFWCSKARPGNSASLRISFALSAASRTGLFRSPPSVRICRS